MKLKIFAWLLAVLCIVLPVAGCGEKECSGHVDANKDAICDECGAAVACDPHVDADGNFACDVCGSAVTPECELHADDDKNLACDICGATLTAPCDPHKDINADNRCDVCNGAIVIVTQPLAPKDEVRVDMVVSTIPEGIAIGEYLKTAPNRLVAPANATRLGLGTLHESYYYMAEEDKETGLSNHTVTNLLNGAVIYERTETVPDEIDVKFFDCFFRVTVFDETGLEDFYYVYGDAFVESPFATQKIALEEITTVSRGFEEQRLTNQNLLFTMNGLGYAFHGTKLLAGPLDLYTFVDRPAFDRGMQGEKYGYTSYNGKIYAYDLDQWISCAYSYSIPSYYERINTFLLENGNLLLQASVQLPDNAVSYDYLAGSIKFDLVYVILSPSEKTATSVEFGYYIVAMLQPDADSIFTDRVPNRVRVHRIVNDRIDSNAAKDFVVDNNLKILYDCAETLKEWDGATDVRLVAENRYLVEIPMSKDITLRKVFDEKGEFVCELPSAAKLYDAYVVYNGKFYSYDMELLLDPEEQGYRLFESRVHNAYSILTSAPTESDFRIYYYNGVGDPVPIGEQGSYVSFHAEHGFVVSKARMIDDPTPVLYDYYNKDGEYVVTVSERVPTYQILDEKTGYYVLTAYDGSTYLVK